MLINMQKKLYLTLQQNQRMLNKTWFTDDCKTAIKQRKGALRPTYDNFKNYRIFRAKVRRTIKESKTKSWKHNSRISKKKVGDMGRKIQGKGNSCSLGHLNVNKSKVTSQKDFSNTLADVFSKNSFSEKHSQKFKNIKQEKEKHLKFSSDNSENQSFSLSVLKDAPSKAHDSSPGPHDIHHQLLKHLPDSSLSVLLKLFNDIWGTGNVPKSWKEARIT